MITIARLTFKEAVRKKILIAALVLTLLFIALYGMGLYYAADDFGTNRGFEGRGMNGASSAQMGFMVEQSKRIMLLLGIYFSSSIVSILAIFSAVGSVAAEVENGIL